MSTTWLEAIGVVICLAFTPRAVKAAARESVRGVRWLAWWWSGCREDNAYPCPICGYDIRQTPHRCPECGTKLRWGMLPRGGGRGE